MPKQSRSAASRARSIDVPPRRLDLLWAPVDAASLAFFRIAFGALMVSDLAAYIFGGRLQRLYLDPTNHFYYPGFSWVRPLPDGGLWALFMVLAVCAAGIAVGQSYRVVSSIFAVGLLYVFLIDATNYNNHNYLIVVLAFLLWLVPAHRLASWDARRKRAPARATVEAWCLWLLRFQVAMPYVFGGIAKINSDWLLRAQPMATWLATGGAGDGLHLSFLDQRWLAYFLSWGGMLFDLLIVPALLWRRTRLWAFAVSAAFHVGNALLFNIGVFPWLMIAANTLFFDPGWPRRVPLLRGWLGKPSTARAACEWATPLLTAALATWVALQLTLPLRHFLYPGNVDWTEEGHRFAWRMKVRDKRGEIHFSAVDPASRKMLVLEDADSLLTAGQWGMTTHDPELLRQLAVALRDALEKRTGQRYQILVDARLSLNARPPKPLVDPAIDLASQPASLLPKPWIVPLPETGGAKVPS